MRRYFLAGLCIIGCFALLPKRTSAAEPGWIISNPGGLGQQHLDPVLGLDFDGNAVVPGIWYDLPILKNGFLPINESLEAELGGFVGLGDVSWIMPAGGLRWTFYLLSSWDMFVTLKLAYQFILDGPGDDLRFGGALGGDWRFNKSTAMRIEASVYGRHASFLTAGLAFFF
jgi:hypothetical protein